MRFDLLFDDLEAQLDAQGAAAEAHEQIERTRLAAARTALHDRVVAIGALGPTRLQLVGGIVIDLTVIASGRDWVAGGLGGGAEAVVPTAAITDVVLSAEARRASRARMPEPPSASAAARLGIGVVLRDLARRRVAVDVVRLGQTAPLHGTIDRVGADHFDLAVHENGAAPRHANVLEHRIIALAATTMLRV